MRKQRTYQTDKPQKLVLHCESCSVEATELHLIKGGFLYCRDCQEAHNRRDRFKREEAEWNATEKSNFSVD